MNVSALESEAFSLAAEPHIQSLISTMESKLSKCSLKLCALTTEFAKFLVAMRYGVTPVPIPNTMVKTITADDTALETVWESRWLPDLCGGVAQLGEHLPCKQGVKSSNLSISMQHEAKAECFVP